MGWASGSEIAEDIWDLVSKYVPEDKKKSVAKKFIKLFEDADCDTMEECELLMRDAKGKKKVATK